MLPIMFLLYLFRQALSLTLSPILRTTIFFTEAIHTMILYTCNLMQDLLENNSEKSNSDESLLTIMSSNHNSDLISSNYNDCVSTCLQTEKQPISSFRNKKAKNTEVILHNVDSSKKVIVIQNSSSKEKRKSARRKSRKSGTRALFRKKETVLKNELTKQSPGKNQYSSDSSNMSLENDVSDAKIIDYSQNISLPKSAYQCNLSLSPSKNDLNCIKSPKVPYENSIPEISRNIESSVIETPEEYDGSQQHKTSSPVEHFEKNEWEKIWNIFSKNQAKNETFKKFSDLYQTIENVQKYNTNTLESTFVSDNKIERRSSLPAKFNKTNEATIDLTHFYDQLIEVINSPRSKRDSTDLKFPIPFKEYLANKRSNEINDSKGEILSSSSYESLPVSDNFRSILERNPMCLHKSSTDDVNSNFSSVDDLIEAFQKVKDELTVLKAVEKKKSCDSSSNDNSTEEVNSSENPETGEPLECKYSEKSACETQNDNLNNQIVPEIVSDDVKTQTPYFNIDMMKQRRSQYLACRTFSNDSAILNPDNSAVNDAIEAMLNIITKPLH